ncbi:MAG: ATP-binding protein [Myxococcota bacterium]
MARILPEGLRGAERMRLSLIVYGIGLMGSLIVVWIPVEFAIGSPVAATMMLVLLSVLIAAMVSLRRGAFQRATHLLLSVYASTTSATTLMGGGAGLENLLPLVLLPIFAGAVSRGRRILFIWAGISVALVSGYWVLYTHELTLPAPPHADTIGFVTLMVFVPLAAFMAILFGMLRERALEDAGALNAALTEQRDRAEAASAAKSAFLAVMSHEFRTPLSGVLGSVDLLLQTPTNEEQTEYLEIVRSSASALLEQLNAVLDFAHLEQGRVRLSMQRTDINTLCEESLRAHELVARQQHLALHIHLEDPGPMALLDTARLRQILYNLLGNAVKFTEQGTITVRAGRAGSVAFIEVEDTGIGIPADQVEDIFHPFTQLDASSSRRFEGVGLGLSLSRRLAEQMGGTLTVDSTPGQGSCFRLEFAAYIPSASAAKRSTSVLGRIEPSIRVLVVEDNPVNQLIAERLLASVGCAVDIAADGREAIEMTDDRHYELILMDCMMPVVDGFTATRQIRGRGGPSATAPIIALTANALEQDRRRCIDAGMDEHVPKPLTRELANGILQQWCQLPETPQKSNVIS